jgi:putative hydrolase of the HAD superfamily
MTWLLCDYGEVLSGPPTEQDRARLAALAAWDPAHGDFWAAYWLDRAAYDRADLTAHQYWTRLLGRPPAAEQLARLTDADTAGWLHPNHETLAAARRAGRRGLRLAILSNAPVEVADGIDAAPWLAPFTRRFFSCRLREVKPDPAVYRAVLTELDARPEEVVFFDDRAANVAAASHLGIEAHLFRHPGQFDEVVNGSGAR